MLHFRLGAAVRVLFHTEGAVIFNYPPVVEGGCDYDCEACVAAAAVVVPVQPLDA